MLRVMGFLLVFVVLLSIFLLRMIRESEEQGDLPRFCIIEDGVYRGGQPTAKGFQFLAQNGIKTVINLRAEDNSESSIVPQLGMHYVQIPVDEVRPWSVIPPTAVAKFFDVLNNRENYPIFFHCHRGADRTGTLAALYRMAIDHWDATSAYAEARDIGMRWYYVMLRSQIYGFSTPETATVSPAGRN